MDRLATCPIRPKTRFGTDLRPDLEASGLRDFDYMTSFTNFLILAEIYSGKVSPDLNLGNYKAVYQRTAYLVPW